MRFPLCAVIINYSLNIESNILSDRFFRISLTYLGNKFKKVKVTFTQQGCEVYSHDDIDLLAP